MSEEDSDYFFGRARETFEVLNGLAASVRLPVLIGNSGVGKSSVAQAGVLALRQDARQFRAQEAQPLAHRNAALQQEGANLIDDAGRPAARAPGAAPASRAGRPSWLRRTSWLGVVPPRRSLPHRDSRSFDLWNTGAHNRRTWQEIGDRVSRFAGALRAHSLGRGDRIAVLMLNQDRYIEWPPVGRVP